MDGLILLTGIFCSIAAALHFASIATVIARLRNHHQAAPLSNETNGVTILRPVCGIENFIIETLRTTFRLDYPRYEILFCLADTNDPVVPIVRGFGPLRGRGPDTRCFADANIFGELGVVRLRKLQGRRPSMKGMTELVLCHRARAQFKGFERGRSFEHATRPAPSSLPQALQKFASRVTSPFRERWRGSLRFPYSKDLAQ